MGKALDLLMNQKQETEAPGSSVSEEELSPARRALLSVKKEDIGPGGSYSPAPKRDIGVVGATLGGLKRGLVEPFSILPGIDRPEIDPRVDETSEKVGDFLGSMVGLGISFIPFMAGTGLALRTLGLSAQIPKVVAGVETLVESPLYAFVRSTLAGSAQFAGTSETLEEVPRKLAEGAAFGAIEGLFLAKAMRVRGGHVIEGNVSGNQLQKEIAVSPSASQTPEQIKTEVKAVFDITPEIFLDPTIDVKPNEAVLPGPRVPSTFDPKHIVEGLGELGVTLPDEMSVDRALVHLARDEKVSSRIVDSKDQNLLVRYARQELPEAQILEREGEVLIYNPSSVEDRLSPKQIAQYHATGFPEGMEVNYTNASGTRTFKATGGIVAEGRVQLQDPINPGLKFAAKIEQVTKLVNPRFHLPENRSIYNSLKEAASSRIGFIIAEGDNSARSGFVDTTGFRTVRDIGEFVKENGAAISKMGGASLEENVQLFARANGIKGLIIKEGEISTLEILDQSAIKFTKSSPPLGVDFDQVKMVLDPATQTPVIKTIIPNWKNSLIEEMRARGIKEKDFQTYLDMRAAEMSENMLKITDESVQNTFNVAKMRYTEGCI